MEVLPPMPRSPEFHFATASTANFPSSPPPFSEPFNYHHHYTSAPSSPTRAAAAIYSNFSFDFSFNSSDPPEISTADKLFEKGKIRPLQHPPPIAAAAASPQSGERGRQKIDSASNFPNRARESRSLSPLRNHSFIKNSTFSTSSSSSSAPNGGNRKWRLKDLLLFRSASEGRATGRGSRDPLRKYTLLSSFTSFSSKSKKKGEEEDSKCGSFRSTESGGGSVRRSGGLPASAHEMHYTANRAAAGEKKKKTPLPYQRQGLFGCLQFNPAIRSITKGFNSFS